MRFIRITNYLLEHRLLALGLTFLITFVPVVGVIGILFAGLVTLRKGIIEGGIFTLAATVPYLISFYITGHQESSTQLVVWAAVSVAVSSNVLTWIFASALQRHVSWSQLLQVAALIGVLFVSVLHLIFPNIGDWWGEQLRAYYVHAAAPLAGIIKNTAHATATAPTEVQNESINLTKQYATGFMTVGILFNSLLQLAIARWWQAFMFNPGLLRRELHEIRLSQLAGGLFILSLIFSYLGNSVVLDMMPILYILFGVAGLSLIHYMFGLMKSAMRWFWLWLMYVTLIFALPTSWILVALIALFDIWLDIRKRLKSF